MHLCRSVLIPTAVLVGIALLASGRSNPETAAMPELLALLAPHVIALLVTLPADFMPSLRTMFKGDREQWGRFVYFGGVAYTYYGWRYAFRSRTRPWGALSRVEKRRANPQRAGVRPDQ